MVPGFISALSFRARIFLAVFLVLGCGTLVFFVIGRRASDQASAENEAARAAARAAHVAALSRDTDADGLKDWEEAIFRTDSQNADTDGDTTPDGEEVKSSRDPLIPGPDDAVATSTTAFVDWEDAPPGSINMTGRLAQALGQQFIAQRLISPEQSLDPKKIAAHIAAGTKEYTPSIPPLTAKDIIITKNESAAAITAWARQFDATLHDAFGTHDRAEIFIMLEAVNKDDYAALAAIDPYITAYDHAILGIKKIPVPAPFAGDHLQFLSLLMQFRDIAGILRAAEEDPVAASATIKSYFELADQMTALNQVIRKKFAQREIHF